MVKSSEWGQNEKALKSDVRQIIAINVIKAGRLGEAAKKVIFLGARSLRPLTLNEPASLCTATFPMQREAKGYILFLILHTQYEYKAATAWKKQEKDK